MDDTSKRQQTSSTESPLRTLRTTAYTAKLTAKPTIDSKQWQTSVDDEAAQQAHRERQ